MATKKKTTTKRRTSSKAGASVSGVATQMGMDESTVVPPVMGHDVEGSELETPGNSFKNKLPTGLPVANVWSKVKQTVTEYPILAVIGVAGIAVTVALATRD